MPTQLLSQSEAFTGMTGLRGLSISMQFLSYLKNLTPLCENKPEMISLARIRRRGRKQNPACAGCGAIAPSVFEAERHLSKGWQLKIVFSPVLSERAPLMRRGAGPRRPAFNNRD